MRRNLRLYWLFSLYSIKTTTRQRLGMVLFITGKIVRFTVFFVYVYQIVSRSGLLSGYGLYQTIVFYLTFNFIDNLGQLLFREVYRFRPLVVSGELSGILIKPYHPFMRVLVGGIDVLDVFMLIPYTALLVYYIQMAGGYTMATLAGYILLMANALVIATSFHILVLAIGILTTEVDHATLIYRDISRMGSLPTDIYKEPVRSLLTFVVPIAIMMTMPVKSLFGLLTPNMFIYCFAISAAFLGCSLWMWQLALKKYQSWGG